MQKPKTLCQKCQCSISNNNYNKHVNSCKGKISWFVRNANGLPVSNKSNKKYDIENYDWNEIQKYYNDNHTFMEVCKEFKCSTTLLSIASKQGLLVTRARSNTAKLRGKYENLKLSDKTKENIRAGMRKAVLEGRQKTPKPYGKFCKVFHHISWLGNEEVLHAGWELKVALHLDAKQIKWTKSKQSVTYTFNGNLHEYFPDFYLEDLGYYVEVKGRQTEKDLAKWEQFPHKLRVLNKNHINKLEEFFSV